jgi:hypothetical protein
MQLSIINTRSPQTKDKLKILWRLLICWLFYQRHQLLLLRIILLFFQKTLQPFYDLHLKDFWTICFFVQLPRFIFFWQFPLRLFNITTLKFLKVLINFQISHSIFLIHPHLFFIFFRLAIILITLLMLLYPRSCHPKLHNNGTWIYFILLISKLNNSIYICDYMFNI